MPSYQYTSKTELKEAIHASYLLLDSEYKEVVENQKDIRTGPWLDGFTSTQWHRLKHSEPRYENGRNTMLCIDEKKCMLCYNT